MLGAGLVLTIGALLFVLQHYRRKKSNLEKNPGSTTQKIFEVPGNDGSKELDGTRQFELDTEKESRYELRG